MLILKNLKACLIFLIYFRESPYDPPIIKVIVEYPVIVRWLILSASSSEVNCFPVKAKEIKH